MLAARRVVTDCLDREWGIIETSGGRPAEEAWIKDEAKGVLLTGYREVTHHPSVSTVLAGKHLFSLFRSLFGTFSANASTHGRLISGSFIMQERRPPRSTTFGCAYTARARALMSIRTTTGWEWTYRLDRSLLY